MDNLIGRFLTPCVRLTPHRVPDGQGGFVTQWTEGAAFTAAIVKKSSAQTQSAEKSALSEVYSVTTPPGVGLMFGDVYRRSLDGATFRTTSSSTDSRPPRGAGFDFERTMAERWELV